jgi:hypothetical protein
MDGDRIVGVRAAKCGDVVAVLVAFVVSDETEAWQQIDETMSRGMVLAISPALELHVPAHWEGRYQLVGQAELGAWTAGVRRMIANRQVAHDGNLQLSEHVNRAVAGRTHGGSSLTLSSARSPGPIELCRAMVWAVALAAKPSGRRAPAIGFSGR